MGVAPFSMSLAVDGDGRGDPLEPHVGVGVGFAYEVLGAGLDDAEERLVLRDDRRADETDRPTRALQLFDALADALDGAGQLLDTRAWGVVLDEVCLPCFVALPAS